MMIPQNAHTVTCKFKQRAQASHIIHNLAHQPHHAPALPHSRASCQHPEAQDGREQRAERDWGLSLEQRNTEEDLG